MALSQSIDDAREERIGRHGVTAPAFADTLARTAGALALIRARHADGKLPVQVFLVDFNGKLLGQCPAATESSNEGTR